MGDGDYTVASPGRYLLEDGFANVLSSRPSISKPNRRQHMQCGLLRSAIKNRNSNQYVFRTFLGVFHKHVEIAIIFKDTSVHQFILKLVSHFLPVGSYQVVVWKCSLRVFVQILHVRVGWCAVQIEVVFLHIFAVITFTIRQAKEALFEDWILAIPQRQSKAEILLVIGNSRKPVFAPAVGA